MATHSSILAWEIPWTEEPGGPQSITLQKQPELTYICMQAQMIRPVALSGKWIE